MSDPAATSTSTGEGPAPHHPHTGPRFRWSVGRWMRVLAMSAAVGVVVGLAAAAVELFLHAGVPLLVGRFTHVGGADLIGLRLEILFLPALGGLISGLVVSALCPPSKLGGTEAAVHAFHHDGGRLAPGPPAVKAAANVVVISCGGSVGPEGPIAGVGASFGSALSDLFRLGPRERRLFLLAGIAAGVSAMFRSPLGGALFATTVPYCDPENEDEALVPAIVAAVASYAVFMAFYGHGHPLLRGTEHLTFSSPLELIPYVALAAACAGAAWLFATCIRLAEWTPLTRLPRWLAPAAAGLITGGVACLVPQVLDARYAFVQGALDGGLFDGRHAWLTWAGLCALVVLAKCVATACAVATGTSGGTLGPSVFIGGVTGAGVGALVEAIAPGVFPEHLRAALIPVGMAGVLTVTMRVPLAMAVMTTEITGSYGLIVPLMLVTTLAYLLGRRFGLNHEQVSSPIESPAHAGREVVSVLETAKVADVLERDPPEVARGACTLGRLRAIATGRARAPTFVVDPDGRVIGVVPLALLGEDGPPPELSLREVMSPPPAPVLLDQDLVAALELFHELPLDALPVQDRPGGPLIGVVRRAAIPELLRRWADQGRSRLLSEHVGVRALEQEARLGTILSRLPQTQRHVARRWPVPAEAVGRSLRQADVRRAYGLDVIAVQTAAGETLAPPDPDRPLRADDVLVALGDAAPRAPTAPQPNAQPLSGPSTGHQPPLEG